MLCLFQFVIGFTAFTTEQDCVIRKSNFNNSSSNNSCKENCENIVTINLDMILISVVNVYILNDLILYR